MKTETNTTAKLAAALAALLAMPERDGTQATARTRRDVKREARAALAEARSEMKMSGT